MNATIDPQAVADAVTRLDAAGITVRCHVRPIAQPQRTRGRVEYADHLWVSILARPVGVEPITVAGRIWQELHAVAHGRLHIL